MIRRLLVVAMVLGVTAACTTSSDGSIALVPTTVFVPATVPAGLEGVDGEVARLQLDDDLEAEQQGDSDSDFHMQHGPSEQVPVPEADQPALENQLAAAAAFARAHPLLSDAQAAGYIAQDFVDADGVHATKWALITTRFDPANPSMVIYEGLAPDSKIVALSYVVESVGQEPNGFVGANDRWHQHFGLCVKDGVLRREAFKQKDKCDELSGRYLSGSTLWMLHAWVVPGRSNSWGVFALSNPEWTPVTVPS